MAETAIFARRRAELMRRLGPNAALLVHSPPEARRGAVSGRFRQASDLHYLSGFAEPDATLLIRPGAERERFVLFVRPRDPEREVWDGRRAGVEGAVADFGADAAYPAAELARKLPELCASLDEIHVSLGLDPAFDRVVLRLVTELRASERRGQRPPRALVNPRTILHEMRLVKSPDEIATLRRAAAITAEAHTAAMRAGRPGTGEHELEALIDYTFRRRGGIGPGYATIVGAGDNATILHYIEAASPIAAGQLVLVDAGCEIDFYTADVTRTFPADGRFTPPQRRAYEVVLRTQEEAIRMTRPGVTIDEIHDRCVVLLAEGMVELGLLAAPATARIEDGAYKRYYMHRTSHWLGMDVHDVGDYNPGGRARPLEPGMVITIEPGLYIAAADESAPAELRGIGIRIEDDILVTGGGCEVLTAAVPKSVADVERACAGGGSLTMSLTGKQRRYLRSLGHALAPVIHIGRAGLSDEVVGATESAFGVHELIKVRIGQGTEVDRHAASDELARRTGSEVAQVLGNTMLLYRRHPDKPVIVLPPQDRDRPPTDPPA